MQDNEKYPRIVVKMGLTPMETSVIVKLSPSMEVRIPCLRAVEVKSNVSDYTMVQLNLFATDVEVERELIGDEKEIENLIALLNVINVKLGAKKNET